MDVRPSDLRTVPLFHDLSEADLTALLKVFKKETFEPNTTLLKAGPAATKVRILTAGEVVLHEEGEEKLHLRPVALIGELGGLTGSPRNATATTQTRVELLTASGADLLKLFEANQALGLRFYRGLLDAVTSKLQRDKERTDQIRKNIIRTQKAMKELRDYVLESPETVVSKRVCESLEEHIAKNRRAGYRVTPVPGLPAYVKLEDGTQVPVLEVSNGYLKLEGKAKRLTKDKSLWIGVLALPTSEIAVSGSIEREGKDSVVVKLDTLVDEYRTALEDYVTKIQLLDFVV